MLLIFNQRSNDDIEKIEILINQPQVEVAEVSSGKILEAQINPVYTKNLSVVENIYKVPNLNCICKRFIILVDIFCPSESA
jgi:hypothetical protein